MRVLLTDGSGLTSKQTAYRLGTMGHQVEVLAPDVWCLSRFTRYVHKVHRVPSYGSDPWAWLDSALSIWAAGEFDLLFPTQEQVAVLSASHERLTEAGVVTAVPAFDALAAVQDKVSAFRTLARLGLPQPEGWVIASSDQLAGWHALPSFVKEPIGTATSGVHLVRTRAEMVELATAFGRRRAVGPGGILVQAPVAGPLIMVQTVFDHGALVAFHACERLEEGTNGGASHKRSVELPSTRQDLETLGRDLGWQGALSADVIVGDDGPLIIDVNPRLVEPGNALASGVDLVGAVTDVALGVPTPKAVEGRTGVRTHQLLLAVLGAAERGGRGRVAGELLAAFAHRGGYQASVEELSPLRHDPLAAVPPAAAAIATLVRPDASRWFTRGSVSSYALTPEGWQSILDAAPRRPGSGWRR